MVGNLYAQVAKKVMSESLGVKKGETVTIETWNNGLAFACEAVKDARRKGCIPITMFEDEDAYLDGMKNMPKDTLGLMGKHEYALLASSDAYIFIPGPLLGGYYKKVNPEERENATRYSDSWYEAAEKARLRGVRVSFGYVGTDMARYLGKSVQQIVQCQLIASMARFEDIKAKARSLLARLRDGVRALGHACERFRKMTDYIRLT